MKTGFQDLLICLLTLLLPAIALQAQEPGKYEGTLRAPGISLEMFIDLKQEEESWIGSLDIPVQMIKDMALEDLIITPDSMFWSLPEVPGNAHYKAAIDGDSVVGTFTQMGRPMELTFVLQRWDALLPQKVEAIAQLADSALQVAHVAGMGMAIVYRGEILLSRGFGYRNLKEEEKADEHTLFAIGSTTKAITAAGLAKLVTGGLLSWDDPVKDHIVDFRMKDDFATEEMTPIDLLCHNSGLPRHDLLWYSSPFSREELLHKLRYLQPTKSFRSTWQYQNLMYMTAGILLERITGQSWEDWTRAELLDPLGMHRTNFSVDDLKSDTNASVGYSYKHDQFEALPYRNLDAIGPAGSINSSASDMAQWIKLLLNQGKVDQESLIGSAEMQQLLRPHMTVDSKSQFKGRSGRNYGLGWMIEWYQGMKVLKHGGNIDGFSAHVELIPEKELGVVILSNAGSTALPGLLSMQVIDMILDMEPVDYLGAVYGDGKEEGISEQPQDSLDQKVPGTHPSHPGDSYTGTFHHPAYGNLQIKLQDDSLVLQYHDLNAVLRHYHYDVFELDWRAIDDKMKVQFTTDLYGNIQACKLKLEPTVDAISFERTADASLTDVEYLKQFTGTFQIPDGLRITIRLTGNKLYIDPAGQSSYQLIPERDLYFRPLGLDGYKVSFEREEGQIHAAVLIQPNGSFRATRLD